MELHKALFIAMIGLFASEVDAQSAAMPDVSEFAVGDRWEWRQFDNRTKLEEPGRSVVVVEDKGARAVMVEGMQRPLDYPYVGEPSAKPWRVWPLAVGKQWSIDVDYVRPDGPTGNLKQDARVVAYEEVTVPAGKFMAFKIEQDGYVRTSTGFNGRVVDTFWYAPAARADVKHVRRIAKQDFTRELVKYPAPSAAPGQQLAAPQSAGTPAALSVVATAKPSSTTAPTTPDSTRANRLRELGEAVSATPNIHMVYMGGNDCPPCRVWRGMELPKLEATEIYKRIKFTYVTKVITSSVPPTFFLPDDVKPYKNVLDYASNGNSGSSQTAILVNGKVFDYYFGSRSAADVEKMLMAIESGSQYPFARCMRFIKSSPPRSCESNG